MKISIRNLSKQYPGGKYALTGISLDIDSGMFGLLGPNGAGKTTLMRILVTLLNPNSGTVTVDGMDLQKNRKQIRQMMGYLPCQTSLIRERRCLPRARLARKRRSSRRRCRPRSRFCDGRQGG